MLSEIVIEKLKNMFNRVQELEGMLSDPKVMANSEAYTKYSKEHSALLPFAQKFKEFEKLSQDLKNLEELKNSGDTELKIIAEAEHAELMKRFNKFEQEIKYFLIPPDPNDAKNIIVEIRAGTGGGGGTFCRGSFKDVYKICRKQRLEG